MKMAHCVGTVIRLSQPTFQGNYASGNQSVAIGVNDIIQNDLNSFIEDNIDDIDNNCFDGIYERILLQFGDENAKILIPGLKKMFHESGIDDLTHMTQLPPYYCYHDLDTDKFEIPYNIVEVFHSALEHMPNLDTIVWYTKYPNNLNPFPSYYSIYHVLETYMAHWKPLTIDFPDRNYDKKWVKDLKIFLKCKKNQITGELKNLKIKFNDKKKEIKVI